MTNEDIVYLLDKNWMPDVLPNDSVTLFRDERRKAWIIETGDGQLGASAIDLNGDESHATGFGCIHDAEEFVTCTSLSKPIV